MRLLKMKILELLDRHKQVTAVADALGLKQPTVSFHMKKMESEWGVKLFEPRSGRIHLTAAGKTLLPYARQIGESYAEAEAAIEELKGSGRSAVRIGFTDCAMAALARKGSLAALAEAVGGMRIVVVRKDEETLIRLAASGRIDLALSGRPPEVAGNMRYAEILASRLKLIEPPVRSPSGPEEREDESPGVWPLLEHAEPSVSSLAESWKSLRRAPASPYAAFDSAELVLRAVRDGLGVALLPECVLDDEGRKSVSAHSPDLLAPWILYACWIPNEWNAKPLFALVDALRRTAGAG